MIRKTIQTASIFFFSGTGNAEKVSNWIADEFLKHEIETAVVNISPIRHKKIETNSFDLIGFCAPTHGFNFPPVMMHFLLKFPTSKGQKAFLVNTRAGMKMGKWFLPGLSGLAQFFYALVLSLKGYKIVGMRSIDLPSNWISIHPGLKEKVVDSIMLRCKEISIKFAQKLASGNKDLNALFDLIQDILISPISIGYYFFGRFVFAKSFYADKYCTRCNKCINECPIGAIKKVDSRPFWTHRCESCMHCMNNCPVDAIQTAHGFIIGLFYLISVLMMKYGWEILINSTDIKLLNFIYSSSLLRFSVETVIAILFLIVAYRIFHSLLKIPLFERLIAFTSLTTLKSWRRFKGNKIKIA